MTLWVFLISTVRASLEYCACFVFFYFYSVVSVMFITFQYHFFLQTFVNWKEARLTWSFFKQSFLKQILTEGEAWCCDGEGLVNIICEIDLKLEKAGGGVGMWLWDCCQQMLPTWMKFLRVFWTRCCPVWLCLLNT